MANTTTISHPHIGNIKASTTKEGVIQCLGLQYATLSDRFAPAVMKEYSSSETTDATRLGPQVLSISPNADNEFALLQHTLEYDRSAFSQSDTEGLCLNITIPTASKGSTDPNAKLPVFVFIHGGAFMVGSGIYPQYDMARFVRLSVQEGKPCIGVTMNYRLGAPGFLTSASMRERGYKPNNAFRDQRIALLWLQKHISGFGGDPGNVTLAGESAGGVSVCYHLFSEKPLFKRMISMSGTMLLLPPLSAEDADGNFGKAVKALGIEEGKEVDELLNMDSQQLVGGFAKAGTPLRPVVDGEICPTTFDFASIAANKVKIPGQQWCEAAIIGDCQFDGSILALMFMDRKKDIAPTFCSFIQSSLKPHPGIADKLLAAYSISPNTDDESGLFRILEVANDLNFYIPTLTLRQNLQQSRMKTYVYRFNEPNPWDGQWKGHATHIIDITFMLQNFNEFLDDKQKGTAVEFGKDAIAFISGGEPWEGGGKGVGGGNGGNGMAKVYGPQGKLEVVEDEAEKVGRRRVMLDLAEEVGLDVLNGAFGAFRTGPVSV